MTKLEYGKTKLLNSYYCRYLEVKVYYKTTLLFENYSYPSNLDI